MTDDFQDDGGTPMWRARHARHEPEVVDVYRRTFRAWWRRASVGKIFVYSFLFFGFLGFGLPAIGFIGLIVYDRLTFLPDRGPLPAADEAHHH